MELPDNVILLPMPKTQGKDDLYLTGAHMVSALRDEIEKQGLMSQGLNFSFDMLIYGLNKEQ